MKAQERQLSLVACLLNHRYGRTLDQLIRDIPDYGDGEAARKKFQRDRRLLEELGVLIRMDVLEGEDPAATCSMSTAWTAASCLPARWT
jgi:hypothetical protein